MTYGSPEASYREFRSRQMFVYRCRLSDDSRGPSVGRLGIFWGVPGASWGLLGPPGASWGLWGPLGACWGFRGVCFDYVLIML